MSTETADARMEDEVVRVDIEDIVAPDSRDKLHPYENEDDEDEDSNWNEFKRSVGTNPDYELLVWEQNEGEYRLLDGDRRLRAIKENGGSTAPVKVYGPDELTEEEFVSKRIAQNEQRKPSDPEQRSKATARYVAPWYLPPGEREYDEQRATQKEFTEMVSKSQGTISNWVGAVKDRYPLRRVVVDMAPGNNPSPDQVEQIDRIVDILQSGGDVDGGIMVIPERFEGETASEVEDMEGLTLSDLESVAETAAEEGWTRDEFVNTLWEDYAYDDETEDVNEGPVSEDGPELEDPQSTTTYDNPEDGPVETENPETETQDTDSPFGEVNFDPEEIRDLVEDDDLTSQATVDAVMDRTMTSVSLGSQDLDDVTAQAAVTVNLLSRYHGITTGEVFEKFVAPEIVKAGFKHLEDEQTKGEDE